MERSGIPAAVIWGKLQEDRESRLFRYLPLEHHCLDVASVFRGIVALPSFRSRLDLAARVSLTDGQLDRLAVLAFLHDFGKANLGFQNKPFDLSAPRAGHVHEVAPLLNESDLANELARALDWTTLENWFVCRETLEDYLFAILSHHGRPLSTDDLSTAARNYYLAKTRWWRDDGQRHPFRAISTLMSTVRLAFPGAFCEHVSPLPAASPLQHRFAGVLMLSDWLGSDEGFFPVDNGTTDRFELAPRAARRAITAVGLEAREFQETLANSAPSFEGIFGFAPRPLQQALDALSVDDAAHRLVIAEAETGSGKTEAALARFFRLFAARKVDGLYFALPTRVAARELYERVKRCVAHAFPHPGSRPLVLQAVPGYARTNGQEAALPDPDRCWTDEARARQRERAWAAERPKRFLAATIAVGTIDQALLSAIQTPHAHLRSVCLDRQLLVVDEVHASDRYMGYLLGELLRHHIQGGHALLLSATLGGTARRSFTGIMKEESEPLDLSAAIRTPYPALTNATGDHLALPDGRTTAKEIEVECLPCLTRPETVLPRIRQALESGARVLVVCNTVARVLSLQRAAENCGYFPAGALFRCEGVVTPHHGRYAPADREKMDAAVTRSLGKDSGPGALLLIGTQTLEQSLDIDADLLIADLCPMDVLLQRIGRLHRDPNRKRPEGRCKQATCLVLVPAIDSLESWLGTGGEACRAAKRLGLGSVYSDLRVLQRTWEALREQPSLTIPRDNRRLVEAATHPESLDRLRGDRWLRHTTLIEGGTLAQDIRADQVSLVKRYAQPFGSFSFGDLGMRARTRLGLGSLRLILPEPQSSPFGVLLDEMMIPGHMAPDGDDATITDLSRREDGFCFRLADKNYRYTRLGLEYDNEPAD